jgi:hypothetical protein
VAVEKDYLNLTLGNRLKEVRKDIAKAQKGDYHINNRGVNRSGVLVPLQEKEEKLLKKISRHGIDYIEGAKKSTRNPFRMVGTNVSY